MNIKYNKSSQETVKYLGEPVKLAFILTYYTPELPYMAQNESLSHGDACTIIAAAEQLRNLPKGKHG